MCLSKKHAVWQQMTVTSPTDTAPTPCVSLNVKESRRVLRRKALIMLEVNIQNTELRNERIKLMTSCENHECFKVPENCTVWFFFKIFLILAHCIVSVCYHVSHHLKNKVMRTFLPEAQFSVKHTGFADMDADGKLHAGCETLCKSK